MAYMRTQLRESMQGLGLSPSDYGTNQQGLIAYKTTAGKTAIMNLQKAINVVAKKIGNTTPISVDGIIGANTHSLALTIATSMGMPYLATTPSLTAANAENLAKEMTAYAAKIGTKSEPSLLDKIFGVVKTGAAGAVDYYGQQKRAEGAAMATMPGGASASGTILGMQPVTAAIVGGGALLLIVLATRKKSAPAAQGV